MEGELINIERDQHLAGKTVHIFNYLDDTKKIAVVQEIDLAEREILVDYDDGTQEWIRVDGRKIRFPPILKPEEESILVTKKRRSSKKYDTSELTENSKIKTRKSVQNSYKAGSVKKSNTNSSKMVNSSKSHSKSKKVTMKSSGFLRLKFKNNEKPTKTFAKIESSKKRKRTEEVYDYTVESANSSNETSNLVGSGNTNSKQTSKSTSQKSKKSNKEISKLKIKLGKKEASVLNPENNTSPPDTMKTNILKREATTNELIPSSKESTKPFGSSISEKKIKTLLPNMRILESSSKKQTRKIIAESNLVSSPATPSETLAPLRPSSSLASVYSSGNTTPSLTLPPTSAGYICPKLYCKKPPFRTENLLMMHIKHYHKEYRNMLSSMPNVADLAYARTVGEQIESPQAGCLEKIVQFEEGRVKDKMDDETLHRKSSDLDNTDKTLYQSSRPLSKGNKRTSMSKRLSGSEPSSPKVSVLVAQLQEPPLVSRSISIQSDAEVSVSQHKLAFISSPQFSDLSNSVIDSDEKQSDGKTPTTKKRRMSQLDSSDVINCLCGYGIEDGLMVQCVLCQCWQHGMCMNFENEADVPSNYTCEICQFPKRGHSSRKYMYVQNWLRDGVIPRYRFNKQREEVSAKRGEFLKASHYLLCELTELKHAVVNLQIKIQVLRQTPDHPKLYLWAKSWNDQIKEEKETQQTSDGGPVLDDAINPTHCRKHLSQHIEEEVQKADIMLKNIEKRIEELEKVDAGDNNEEEEEEDEFNQDPEKYTSVAKQTLLMLLRDLSALQTLKYWEHRP